MRDATLTTGTYQVIYHRRECKRANIQWKARYRDLAGHLVPRVSEHETEEESTGYHPRREDVKASWYKMENGSEMEKSTESRNIYYALVRKAVASGFSIKPDYVLIPTTAKFRGLFL